MNEDEKTLDDLLKSAGNLKNQTYGLNSELNTHNALLAEIDNEVGEDLGLMENGIKKLSAVMNYTSDRCLMITICVLAFLLLMIMLN